MAFSSRTQSVTTSIKMCPLPRQARAGIAKKLTTLEFRVVPEDALLVEGQCGPPRAPPGWDR